MYVPLVLSGEPLAPLSLTGCSVGRCGVILVISALLTNVKVLPVSNSALVLDPSMNTSATGRGSEMGAVKQQESIVQKLMKTDGRAGELGPPFLSCFPSPPCRRIGPRGPCLKAPHAGPPLPSLLERGQRDVVCGPCGCRVGPCFLVHVSGMGAGVLALGRPWQSVRTIGSCNNGCVTCL